MSDRHARATEVGSPRSTSRNRSVPHSSHEEALSRYIRAIAAGSAHHRTGAARADHSTATAGEPTLIREVMTSSVVTVKPGATFKAIAQILDDARVSAVPVVDDDGSVLGVVSRADLLAHAAAPVAAEQGRGRLRPRAFAAKAHAVLARELMSSPAVTTTPATPVADAARLAARARVKRLPVIGGDQRLVGIASRGDLLRVFLRSDEDIHQRVMALLGDRFRLDPDVLRVAVHEGIVTVDGRLDEPAASRVVAGIAALDAVVGVEDRLVRGASR